MDKKLTQANGNVVTGDRFWDRKADMALFKQKIDEGAHILVVAQRRIGKTSLLKEAAEQLKDTYICLYVDLEDKADAAGAIVAISMETHQHKPLWEKAKGLFSNVIDKVKDTIESIGISEIEVTLRAGITIGDWAMKGDHLFEILASSDKPVVLMMDEVPVMVNRMLKGENFTMTSERRKNVDDFMSWLRKNSIRYQGKIRIVIAGSIGFEPILKQASMSASINNFHRFELSPWDEETAAGCLHALANKYAVHYNDSAEREMLKLLGCFIPHHVQMFFSYVHELCIRKSQKDIYPKDVQKVFAESMLGAKGYSEMAYYEDKLKLVLGPSIMPLAIDILSETALHGCLVNNVLDAIIDYYAKDGNNFDGRNRNDVKEEILRVFEHDGYLRRTQCGHVFVSNLFQEWCNKKYGQFYTPILKREG